ncbi:MAG: serine hydrolase domain-containing protein [Candidatus Babeliales bacterium]|uniref:Beta-lactamase family protein n=2 Tax=Candidatus Berkiella aquae TaxID=295108 RepID=A0AAE3HYM2_9GAMM|nr:serine hydrolase domain-containing protein [Candidatus Berkiella aquae]MCS5712927.1 beta-lactamase family protein [Candidatus Berkiella aquae]
MPQVLLNNGSTFSYPDTWKCEELEGRVKLLGPESDFKVNCLVLPAVEGALAQAWQQINPNFDLKIAQQFSLPPAWLGGFWESGQQIVYDLPLSESRTVMALVRNYQNQAYISLIEATNSALQRRGAELGQMMESWKPKGAQEQNLKDQEVRQWSEEQFQDFDKFIESGMDKLKIPGFAIAIMHRNGKTMLSKGYGVKKLGSSESVTPDTPFMIGSTTKALTTFMMGTMVDQGTIKWDTPVCEVLDSFKLNDPLLTQQMNARLTVSASTGMPRRDFDFIFNYSTPEERLKQMQEMKPTTALGETFQYSNLLFMVGGYMAAHAYAPSKSLTDAYTYSMEELVFKPLEMNHTTLKAREAQANGAASPHSFDINGELTEIPVNIEQSCGSIAPSGAIWSTVKDMSQYLLAELNHGALNGKRVISEKALLERRRPGIKMGDKSHYGLGLIINEEQGLQVISHGGGTMGFACDLFFYPEKGIGVVMMANSRYGHTFLSAVKQQFLELTFGAKVQAEEIINISMSQQAEILRKVRADVSLECDKLQWIKPYVGEYSNPHLGKTKITQTQEGFEITCKEWKSRLGAQIDQNGARYLVLIDPPFPGLLKLQEKDSGDLFLDAGQEQYQFKKKSCRE